MTYEMALEMIKLKLRQTRRVTVVQEARISGNTYDRWAEGLITRPSLSVFLKLAIYFDINVKLKELKEVL